MNIKDAATLAMSYGVGMRRVSSMWPDGVIVIPTNTVDCCFLMDICAGKKSRRRGWEPYADDLVADDWELV